MNAMSTRRIALLLAAGFAISGLACAHESGTDRVVLMCPDRALRDSDVDLAVSAAGMQASTAVRQQMLERARSVCAANLSRVTLIAPRDSGTALAASAGPTR
jgi:hypothetical protein